MKSEPFVSNAKIKEEPFDLKNEPIDTIYSEDTYYIDDKEWFIKANEPENYKESNLSTEVFIKDESDDDMPFTEEGFRNEDCLAIKNDEANDSSINEGSSNPFDDSEASEATNSSETRYYCNLCSYSTKVKCNLARHDKSRHCQFKSYVCDQCDYSTTRSDYFKLHLNGKHIKKKQFECFHCGFISYYKNSLIEHIKYIHQNVPKRTDKVFHCEECDYSAVDKYLVNRHFKRKHMELEKLSCGYCNYTSTDKITLKRHIISKHNRSKMHKCDYCDYSSVENSKVKRHAKAKHKVKLETQE